MMTLSVGSHGRFPRLWALVATALLVVMAATPAAFARVDAGGGMWSASAYLPYTENTTLPAFDRWWNEPEIVPYTQYLNLPVFDRWWETGMAPYTEMTAPATPVRVGQYLVY